MKSPLFKSYFLVLIILMSFSSSLALAQSSPKPVRIGVVGLTHTHVHWILGREKRPDIEIVGIVEPNRDLAQRYSDQHGYSMDIVFDTMEEMIAQTKPEAVTAFGTIYEHLEVVQTCAPKGIHVMVEKPLAVSLKHARQMAALARKHDIMLLTNYETTWYASNHEAYKIVHKEEKIGHIRKVVVHDGHPGPKEIGVNQEFLDWLIDPVQNGGGAITDFGCYGANLMTWLMKGEAPLTVTAVTQTIKPDIYPEVDDEATIILTYPKAQGIIQASWNWPINRKDMEVYGKTGVVYTDNGSDLRLRTSEDSPEQKFSIPGRATPVDDPFAYFAALIRKDLDYDTKSLSSLENNMVVMRILDAAIKSARSGKTQKLK
ncbi:MAG: Gfo/Idh/MocA family oxidoreductase [Roseivirga sp.]|nr:Gfo/Idh/MocA family oxidoreductase [Roseivirga sp.]